MRTMFGKLFYLFDARSKIIASLLLVMILVGTILEMFGIGVILPLITLFSAPNPLEANSFLKKMHDWLEPESRAQFIIWILVGVILVYAVKNIYLLFLAYLQTRFIQSQQYQLGSRLFLAYLNSPYQFHLKYNSSELLRNIKLVANVITTVLMPLIVCVTELMVAIVVFLLLVWVDPVSAILITSGLGIFLGGYYWLVRKRMTILGEDYKFHEKEIYQQVYQSLGSIKEIKILGREKFFNEKFCSHLWGFTNTYRISTMIAQSGRFIVESIAVALVLGIVILLLYSGRHPSEVLVTFTLFAVALVRLIPTVNRLNWAVTQIRFGVPSLDEVFTQLKTCESLVEEVFSEMTVDRMNFEHQIEFCDVTHKYEDSDKVSLDAVSFAIPKRSTVALVGPSGAGKTTAMDLVLGLLKPVGGEVLVDGKDIHQSLLSWQQQIGYVPQSIYLTDDTIRNNVAFGVKRELINDEKVWMALRLAQLESFARELPENLNTLVGENGVRFSGGQRQRIGIARALYHEPQVLIMDEATAALDNETERAFMDGIEHLSGERTIILVAHRITTVKNCDIIFFLSNGRLMAAGAYDSLLSTSSEFRQMAQV
jgi:ATP-binding cassette, subfamily B, bacterial PglK